MQTPGQDIDDETLLVRVAEGDITAMGQLYRRHAQTVQRFIHTRIRDHSEVADVLHNTMLDAWRNADRFQGRSSVKSWMLAIARNKATDHIRKQGRVQLAEPDETAPDDSPPAEDVIAAAQNARKVRECVAKLGGHMRSAIHLAFFQELSYPEVAQIEGVPEGTIKTRIYHAKKLLMRCISG